MADQPRPNPRPTLGRILGAAGVGVWLAGRAIGIGSGTGLLPTIPFIGSVTACVGACLVAMGVLLASILIVSALLRDVVLRFDETAAGSPSSVGER